MQCIAQARDCARTVSGVAQPGRQYQENINFSLFCLIPWTLREKCNTSLSQAIPVPNSSLYIICWFIINRLPLQFWSRYFLWINMGLPPPAPRKAIACKPSCLNVKKPSTPANLGSAAVWLLESCVGRRGLFQGYSWKSHSETCYHLPFPDPPVLRGSTMFSS